MGKVAQATAKMGRRGFGIFAKYIFAAVPMVPAMFINVDWTGRAGWGWTLAAILGLVLSAVFVEVSRHARPWHTALIMLAAGLFGCYVNMLVAIQSANHASEDQKHLRNTANFAADTASSQSSQWSTAVADATKIAGTASPATIEAEIQAKALEDPKRWQATQQCAPAYVTSSAAFCRPIGELRAKLAAARDRDANQAKLDVQRSNGTTEVKRVADPFADGFPKFAAGFGVKVDPENATAHLNGMRSMWLELMNGLGPMSVLLLWDMVAAAVGKPKLEPRSAAPRDSPSADQVDDQAEPVRDLKEEARKRRETEAAALQLRHEAFVVDRLDGVNGEALGSNEAWALWQTACRMRGEDPGKDRRAFKARMEASGFTYDINGNRPRFLNVRVKEKAAGFKVHAGGKA